MRLLLALPLLAGPSWAAPAQDIRVSVDAVSATVLVTGAKGKPIEGLRREQFRLFEDGVEQTIENFFPTDAPYSLVLALDTSLSTEGKLDLIRQAALDFVSRLEPDDEVLVLGFDDRVRVLCDFTRDRSEIGRAIAATRTGRATAFYDALEVAVRRLRKSTQRPVLVLFSDALDTASGSMAARAFRRARESNLTVYGIFFDTREDMFDHALANPRFRRGTNYQVLLLRMYKQAHGQLAGLARDTGGTVFRAKRDTSGLGEAFARIARELRSLYSVTYYSSSTRPPDKFRKIRVKVGVPKAKVRTRKGYFPSPPP